MTEQFTHGYALVIGVDQNVVSNWALPDVAKDVEALRKVLTHPERCAYPEKNVKVIHGPEATRMGILGGLAWLQQRIQADAGADATAVVYYSGHGWRDESVSPPASYLIPYDILESQIALSALRAADLAAAIAGLSPQRLLVMLDCCHAGGMGVKGLGAPPAGYAEAAIAPVLLMAGKSAAGSDQGAKGLDALAQGSGRAVLSSSTGEQQSYMRPDGAMSIFTYHLIEALTGHAEPKEGATEVLVSDVMSHVWRHVPESARALGAAQTPDYQVSGNFPIALLLGGKGWSKGQPAPDPIAIAGKGSGGRRTINTGGGAYVEGDVHIRGGDFVGRDSIVYGDRVRGNRAPVGSTTGQGTPYGEVEAVFATLTRIVSAMPDGPSKAIAQSAMQGLEQEASKGIGAQESAVHQWFGFLAQAAPDVWKAALAILRAPTGGLSPVFKRAAEQVAAEDEGPV